MIERLIQRRWRAVWAVLGSAALGGVVYGIAVTDPGLGVRGRALAVAMLTVLAAVGWVGWVAATVVADHPRILAPALVTLVIAGGLLTGIDPVSPALVFCGVGVFAAVAALRPALAVALASTGIAVLAAGAVVSDQPLGRPCAYAGVLAAMTLAGFNRRQYRTRLRQAGQLVVQTQQAQAGQARAAALDERTRMAREIHDVLAHSLGALVVQLDVADALLADGRDPGRAHGHVTRARRLAVEGLAETRQAIGALRGDTPPLPVQLSALADCYQADTGTQLAFTVSGIPRELPPEVALAAYRTMQEALSNARKHAPGAPVAIKLDYRDDGLVLVIADHPASGRAAYPVALAGTGGGYGLAGLAERSELIGGVLTAGPDESGWEVRLWLPA